MAVPPATFAEQHWGREPLVSRAADLAGSIEDLFDVAAVDELVSRRGLRTPFLRVAKNGTTFGDREFTDGGGVGATVGDQVSDDKLLRLFADGATLVLQGLHRTWPALIDVTQQLAADLGHPVQANAYVTPAQNTGFSDHYDVHDVFVVQVSGEKAWRVREPVHPSPLRDEPWTSHRAAVESAASRTPLLEVTLRQGDCLYLPRGYLHSATALGGVSTHLTLGVHVWTRRHIADELVGVALRRVSSDETVRAPLDALVDVSRCEDIADDVAVVRAALLRALADVGTDEVATGFGRRWRLSQRAAPIAPVAQTVAAGSLADDDVVHLRDHLAAALGDGDDGKPVLTSRAGDLGLSPDDRSAVERLLDDESMAAADLGLDLARRLLLAGVVVIH